MSEEMRALIEIRDLVKAQNKSFMALIGALQTMSATQAETMRQILDAVTAPVPKSKVPDLLEKIIDMIKEETAIVTSIEDATKRIEEVVSG